MKNFICYLLSITLVLLASCSPATSGNQLNTPAAFPDKTPTVSPPATSATLTTQQPISVEQCFGSRQSLPGNLDGEVILSGKNSSYQFASGLNEVSPYIFIFATGERLTLPQESRDELVDFSVSLDKKWIAYYAQQPSTEGNVYIVGNDGTLLKKYPADNWWGLLGWLDNNHLIISKFADQTPYPSLIFDPFTGKTVQEFLPNYPDIFTGNSAELSAWDRYQLPETVYNSYLNFVVYPTNTTIKNPARKIVLWDIKAGKVLNDISDTWATSRSPLWLSNNHEFIVNVSVSQDINRPNKDELMSIGIDGKTRQLTHLAELNYVNVAIQNYSESADGRYIAFWFAQIHSGPSRLAIYDTVSGNTKVFCTIVGGYLPPVWSPSEHQLLVDATFDSLDNFGTIFVDVESGVLAQVEKGVVPVGWMAAPQQ